MSSRYRTRHGVGRRRLLQLPFALTLVLAVAALVSAAGALRSPTAVASGPFSTVTEFQPALTAGRVWGGRTVATDIDPSDPNTAIAASESGGLFKTTDLGAHWTHIDTLLPFRMADVKYAPGDRNIVLATASSDSGRKVNGGGIFRSTDGGATWSKPATANPPCNARANAWGIAFEPASQNVYVGTDCGVAVSNDRGATWTHVAMAQTFGVSAATGGIVDTCSGDGHHRSTNAGGVFSAANAIGTTGNGSCPGIGAHAIAVAPDDSNLLFAINRLPSSPAPNPCSGTNPVSLWALNESDDGGQNWNPIAQACPSRPPSVGVRPSANGVAGNLDLYFSGGLNYMRGTCTLAQGTANRCAGVLPAANATNVTLDHADPSQVVFSTATSGASLNCAVYIPGDNGVGKSTDCGATFTTTGGGTGGFNALQLYEMTGQTHPGLPSDIYFGTQDNDIWASSDNGVTWPNVQCCEGFFFQIPHSAPTNAGQTITGVTCGGCYTFGGTALFASIPPWNNPLPTVPNPCTFNCTSNPNQNPFLVEPAVYIQFAQPNLGAVTPNGNFALYRTVNTGGAWTKVNLQSPTSPGLITANELNIGIVGRTYISGPPGDPTIFQAYSRPVAGNPIGLLRITGARTANATVTDISTGLNTIDGYCNGQGTFVCPTVFGVDPNDPNHLIAADAGTNNIKVTTNGGNSWTVDNNLTNLVTGNGLYDFDGQTHVIQWDPTDSSTILVGTEANGVEASFDNGVSWSHMLGSEEVPAITTFFFDEVQDDIFISSYGRGMWKIDLPSADLSITKTHHPDPATAGQQLFYDLTVTNNGPDAAPGVIVQDSLPPEVTFVTSTLPCTANSPPPGTGQTLTCTVGDLAPAQSRSFTIKVAVNTDAIAATGPKAITNTATVLTAASGDPNPANNTATDVVIVEDLADLEISKLCKPDTNPTAGQPITCTLFVDNHGPSWARNVVVTDTILAAGAFNVTSVMPSQGTCGAVTAVTGGKRFVCNLGNLASASGTDTGRATITYVVTSAEGQDINNTAEVRSDTPDPDTTNNRVTVALTVKGVADLSLTKTDSPDPVIAGTTLTWSLTVANAGPSSATNVVVSDDVPAGVVVQSVTASGGATCTSGQPGNPALPAKCNFGTLASGASRTMTIVAKVNSGTKGSLENDARVTSDTLDANNANDLATTLTTVNTSADLALTFAADTTTTKPSSTIHYKVTVNNNGPSDADGVVVTVDLPPLKSGYYLKDDGGCTLSNTTLTCPLGTFAAGAPTRTIFIDWFVQGGGKFPIVATASVTAQTSDPNAANNSQSSSVGKK